MILNNRCIHNPDKFGFYQVGNIKTYSKVEAIEVQKRTGHFPEWNFNRSVFDHVNWKIEPPGQLWDYYKARARQIRESYDYCVLFYSGGSDSHNILNAWLEEGCEIDEVASFCYFDAAGTRAFMNSEVDRVAIPIMKELNKVKNINFRLIDFSKDVVDAVDQFSDEWKYLSNFHWTPNSKTILMWRQRIAEYRRMIDSGKKVCFVWGSDKPKVFYDGKLYFQFVDIIDNCISPKMQQEYNNGFFDELFYWTPDMPEIVVKQAHVVKRFVETVHDPAFYEPESTNDTHGAGYNKILKTHLSQWGLKQVIYPRWNPTTFVDGKSPSRVYSIRDTWFINGNLDQSQKFRDLSQGFFSSIDPYWLNDTSNFLKGIKGSVSPKYYLE